MRFDADRREDALVVNAPRGDGPWEEKSKRWLRLRRERLDEAEAKLPSREALERKMWEGIAAREKANGGQRQPGARRSGHTFVHRLTQIAVLIEHNENAVHHCSDCPD